MFSILIITSVQFSRSVMFHSLRPHGLQHARLPCPSPPPGVYSDSCPLSRWCHPTISSSVVPFSSCLQSFPASGSFPVGQFFTSGGQSIRASASASASVLPMNVEDLTKTILLRYINLSHQAFEGATPSFGESPDDPVDRTLYCHCTGWTGLIPNWGIKIPQAKKQTKNPKV